MVLAALQAHHCDYSNEPTDGWAVQRPCFLGQPGQRRAVAAVAAVDEETTSGLVVSARRAVQN